VLSLVQTHVAHRWADDRALVIALIVVMVVAFVAWAITRWLKLNKRIRA
jgi:hypothetical protein